MPCDNATAEAVVVVETVTAAPVTMVTDIVQVEALSVDVLYVVVVVVVMMMIKVAMATIQVVAIIVAVVEYKSKNVH